MMSAVRLDGDYWTEQRADALASALVRADCRACEDWDLPCGFIATCEDRRAQVPATRNTNEGGG
jgi:hypothetical protein